MKKLCSNKFNIGVYIIVIISVLFAVIRSSGLPGLYLDGINPDYLAVQLLYPQEYSVSWALPNSGIPLLGQLYHGTVTMFFSLISIMITGTTSVLQFHILNGIYGIAACIMLYKILGEMKINRYVSAISVILLATTPTLFSSFRTQYYIVLPGVVFTLISIYLLLSWIKDSSKNYKLFFSSVMAGLAFYNYFIYVFFVPAYLILLCMIIKKEKQDYRFEKYVIWADGFVLGSILYIMGYTEIFLEGIVEYRKIVISIILFVIIAIIMAIYKLTKHHKIKIVMLIIGVVVACGMLFFYKNIEILKPYLSNLNMSESQGGFKIRIYNIIKYFFYILNDSSSEILMLGKTVSVFKNIYVVLIIIISAISGTVFLKMRKQKSYKKFEYFWVFFVLGGMYFFCAFLFAHTRLQAQHFVPILFMVFAFGAVEVDYVIKNILKDKIKKNIRYVTIGLATIILILNLYNQSIILINLNNTGGTGLCTNQINELAYSALENAETGEKEVYIFPDWGFMCGFDYLTRNSIAFSLDTGEEALQKFYDNGYTIVICYWSDDDTQKYEELLDNYSNDDFTQKTWYTKNGNIAFYSIMSTN